MAAGHLVAGLQAALHRHIHLDHLLHAGLQLVALGQLLLLQLERRVEFDPLLRQRFLDLLHLHGNRVIRHANVEPLVMFDAVQILVVELATLGQLLRPAVGDLVVQQFFQAGERVGLDDAHLVGQVFLVARQFIVDDLLRALVALQSFAGEHLHVDHGARHTRLHAERSVFHVGSLFAEDRTQQLLFRRQLGLALRRYLAHQHIANSDFGADVHDAALVQTRHLRFR